MLSLARLSKRDSLDNMSAIPLSFAYSYSSAAAETIAAKYGGAKALLRLHSAYNSEKIKGKPGRTLTNRVFKKVLKKSLKQVEADIEAYARRRAALGDRRGSRLRGAKRDRLEIASRIS